MGKAVILCVDDEEVILKSLRILLRVKGYDVFTALNGHTSLEIMDRERIDLIIVDKRMPGMDGDELLKLVQERHPSMPCIMISGCDIKTAGKESGTGGGIVCGAIPFLAKPWDNDELLSLIKKLLNKEGR